MPKLEGSTLMRLKPTFNSTKLLALPSSSGRADRQLLFASSNARRGSEPSVSGSACNQAAAPAAVATARHVRHSSLYDSLPD